MRKCIFAVTVAVFATTGICWGQGSGFSSDKLWFTSYGELHYNGFSNDINRFDLHRFVIGVGYQFTDVISLQSELDFEHAFTAPELEFAYLDFFFRDAFGVRAGVVLMPVGPLNEVHEPVFFYSVERPYVQKYVIPTSWQEPGGGVYGSLLEGALDYRVYVVGGLDAERFRGSDGIRRGRQKGAEAKAEDLAAVGRLEYSPILNLTIGASGYYGKAAQGNSAIKDASVGMIEADATLEYSGFELTGLYAAAFIDNADSISTNNVSGEVVGEQIVGWYGEAAYHLLRRIQRGSNKDLVPFVRFEQFDTHDKVPAGFTKDLSNDREVLTFGVSFFPIPQVVIKADFETWKAGDGAEWEQYNLGIGYAF